MSTTTADAPIRRVSFTSRDADEVSDYIDRLYAGNRVSFGKVHGDTGFSAHFVDAGPVATDRAASSLDFKSCATDPFDFFCSVVVDRGTLRVATAVSDVLLGPGDSTAYPIGHELTIETNNYACRLLRMPFARLEEAAEALGQSPDQLRLEGTAPVTSAMGRYWRNLVAFVSASLTDHESPAAASPLVREELARLTASAALTVFPNTTLSRHYSASPGRVAPAAVRRAVAHIEAHAAQPLSLTDIAGAAGVGVRALQHGFRRHLDTTPLAYLRRVRLERAHRDLQVADPVRGDTVAAIAAKWGFRKGDRFAAEHRAAFGELPSHTLRT